MTKHRLSRILAILLVGGHLVLFAYAFVILFYGRLEFIDIVQVILTGTPLLALSIAAFATVNAGAPGPMEPAEPTAVFLNISFSVVLLGILAFLYTQLMFTAGMSKDVVTASVGLVETGFGAMATIMRNAFFPQ